MNVTIDLTKPGALTLESVAALLASASDATLTQLGVIGGVLALHSATPLTA